LRCSNKSLVPCLWWSTGCRCKLPHKWRVGSCCWATYKVPAKVLHWIDSCRFQLQGNWHTGECTVTVCREILWYLCGIC